MDERPKVYCFIGRVKSGGKGVRSIRRVTLAAAWLATFEGWKVIGPDPQDLERLARWQDRQQPFNQPRLQ